MISSRSNDGTVFLEKTLILARSTIRIPKRAHVKLKTGELVDVSLYLEPNQMNHHDKLTLSIEDSSGSFVVSLVEEDGDQEDEDVTALVSQLSGLGSDCSENPENE